MDVINFSDTCRLCAQQKNQNTKIEENITIEDTGEEVEIRSVVLNFLGIDLEEDPEGLPDEICPDCVDRLIFFYSFKKFCTKNTQSFISQAAHQVIKEEPEFEGKCVDIKNVLCLLQNEPQADPLSQMKQEFPVFTEEFPELLQEVRKEGLSDLAQSQSSKKRRLETEEEAIRRRAKNAERTRRFRNNLRTNNPEQFQKQKEKNAKLRRQRRKELSEEELEKVRARSREAIRERRKYQLKAEPKGKKAMCPSTDVSEIAVEVKQEPLEDFPYLFESFKEAERATTQLPSVAMTRKPETREEANERRSKLAEKKRLSRLKIRLEQPDEYERQKAINRVQRRKGFKRIKPLSSDDSDAELASFES